MEEGDCGDGVKEEEEGGLEKQHLDVEEESEKCKLQRRKKVMKRKDLRTTEKEKCREMLKKKIRRK